MKSVSPSHGMAKAVANIKMRGKLFKTLICGCCDAVNWPKLAKYRKVKRDEEKLRGKYVRRKM